MAEVNFLVKKGLTVPKGSVAAPAIIFDAGDPNTGIYSPGADQLALSTNGTGRLFVDADGKVGIATQFPAAALDLTAVSASARAIDIRGRLADNVADIRFLSNNQSTQYGTISSRGNGDFRWFLSSATGSAQVWTNSSERLRITSAGLVGIGTSSPQTTLHLSASNPQIRLQDSDGTDQYAQVYNSGGTSTFFSRNGTSYGPISFLQYNGTSSTAPLYIDSSQRVGIGTTSLSTYGGKLVVADGAVGGETTLVLANNNQDQFARLGINNNEAQIAWDNADALVFGTATTSATAGLTSEFARIDSSGRLLVGTSSAFGTGKLQVTGGAYNLGTYTNNAFASGFTFIKSRSTTPGQFTIVQSGDELGLLAFQGTDGSAIKTAAVIVGQVDGTPGANDMPGRLVFSVTADGAASPTEALRISSNRAITVSDGGHIVLGTGTGTKIGTSTSQKIGFFDETPIVQPTTGIAEAAFVENSGGTAVNVDSTFGGYTIQQVVQALQNLGLLA